MMSAAERRPVHETSSRRSLQRVVLCVDDDADYLDILARMISGPELRTLGVSCVEDALGCIERERVDVIIVDLKLGSESGLDLIERVRATGHHVPILVLTGAPSVDAAVEALKRGAVDFLAKPADASRLRATLAELMGDTSGPLDRSVERGTDAQWFEGMFGVSDAMRRVFDSIGRVAQTDAPVLIVGESGVGKELVARAIHARSKRQHGAFVPVHLGAIPRDLVASELFGHERGAFTGATSATVGKFAAAAGGTLFLDEISTVVPEVQIVLLRVLESWRFTRVGGRKEQDADVRIVVATNRDLLSLVEEGRFREDLYFRLAVFSVGIPALRERSDDIVPLAEHFRDHFARRHASPACELAADARSALVEHSWPGNVRELRNVIERAVVFASSPALEAADLQLEAPRLESSRIPVAPRFPSEAKPDSSRHEDSVVIPLGTSMHDAEREILLRTLAFVGGNKLRAAQVLGISRRSIYNRLKEYGLAEAHRDADEPDSGAEN